MSTLPTHIIDIFDNIVDSMRTTANILSISEDSGGIYTFTVDDVSDLRDNSYGTITNTVNYNGTNHKITDIDTVLHTFKINIGTEGLSTETGDFKSNEPYYMYGHLLDVSQQLMVKDNDQNLKNQKYPLIILALDITENKEELDDIDKIPLELIIANITKNTYRSQQRKEANFDPILIPTYDKLFSKIKYSSYFDIIDDKLPHKKTERYYWGNEKILGRLNLRNTSNPFNDWLDAIEINIPEIRKIKEINCLI